MRVAVVTPSFFPRTGGAEIVVHQQCKELTRLGHEVHLFVPWRARKPTDVCYHVHHLFPYTATIDDRYLSPQTSTLEWQARYYQRRFDFDIWHIHFAYPYGFFLHHSENPKPRIILTSHGADLQTLPEIEYGMRLDERLDKRIRAAVEAADAVIALNDNIRLILEEFGVDLKRIFRIPNGVYIRHMRSKEMREQARNSLRLNSNLEILIVAVGRNSPVKNYTCLLEAAKILAEEGHDNLHFLLIGKGMRQLGRFTDGPWMKRHVTLWDGIEDLPSGTGPELSAFAGVTPWYAAGDIFVQPSLIEACPLSVLEALAAGLPVVCSRVPGNRDLVRHNENGLLFDPKSPLQLARCLKELAEQSSRREEMSRNAAASAIEYDWSIIGSKLVSCYDEIIRQDRSHGSSRLFERSRAAEAHCSTDIPRSM